jgi:hypothetical protein
MGVTSSAGDMLRLRKVRELHLAQPAEKDGPAYLSAASGLVRCGSDLCVVADDQLFLGRFPATGKAPGTLLRLFDGKLPRKPKKRKQLKPDLEVLLRLPPMPGYRHGALLALGSGSKSTRQRGALLRLGSRDRLHDDVLAIDASPLFERLQREFDALNLEGGWVHGGQLHLLQRGNKGKSPNAVITLKFDQLLAPLLHEGVLPASAPQKLRTHRLGNIDAVPLCFTDACGLGDGRWIFSAVAEATDNPVDDGAFLGAVIGLADANQRVLWQRRVAPHYKIEGIEARVRAGRIEMLCVTDADDPAEPARLLAAAI